MKLRVLSGIQPTGELHIGNYLGSLKNFMALQEQNECFFFIADYHSLTEAYEPREKSQQILEVAASMIAIGLDPKKCTLFIQSDVSETVVLAWIFSTLIPVSHLFRMTQYKEKSQMANESPNAGLFTYPILQAADILLLKAGLVPVGEDQLQHLELTRDVARIFNRRFGQTFPEPKPLLTKVPRLMSLVDPTQKMSKSHGPASYIALNDSPQAIRMKLAKAVTDTGRRMGQREKTPGVANLFLLLSEFGTEEEVVHFERAYEDGIIRYVELKAVLAERIVDHFALFRKKKRELLADKKRLRRIYTRGAQHAHEIAQETMSEVWGKIGLVR
jgi:tryptophanyl-tRNA synthetase